MRMKESLNLKQVDNLKKLIGQHIHEMLADRVKANKTFEKIRRYGVHNMPEAIALYKANRRAI